MLSDQTTKIGRVSKVPPRVSLEGGPAPPDGRGGLLLGYAAVREPGIREGARRLAEALE